MDVVQLLGSTLGLGFISGIRLYATALALGLAIRFHWLHLSAGQQGLRILAEPAILAVAAVMFLIEFLADKIPWVDSLWDSIHTFVRPLGAAIIAAAAITSVDPILKTAVVLICGSVALASHSSKAGTRLLVNHSPEPFSNILLSLGEDLFVPFGVWLSIQHPRAMLAIVLVFAGLALWFAPRIFRIARLQWVALSALVHGRQADAGSAEQPHAMQAIQVISRNAKPLPEPYRSQAAKYFGPGTAPDGIRCAATKKVAALRHSVGYLVPTPDSLVFIARRRFRWRHYVLDQKQIQSASWKRGLLMHRLVFSTSDGEKSFYVFKDTRLARGESSLSAQAQTNSGTAS